MRSLQCRLEYLRKCVSDCIYMYLQVVFIWLDAFSGFNDAGEVEVHLLGYYTVVFVSYDSVRVEADVTNFIF